MTYSGWSKNDVVQAGYLPELLKGGPAVRIQNQLRMITRRLTTCSASSWCVAGVVQGSSFPVSFAGVLSALYTAAVDKYTNLRTPVSKAARPATTNR
jgi:hypothetical protein